MSSHPCTTCKLRARYDRAPRSLLGRLWRWHIGFCPGWKSYLRDLPPEERADVQRKYSLRAE
ncbi:hypothetical protein [Opitutus terrae]|uniref:Uncharacterized protein n=1 Tax=Opitutus terrae (strain DSM 11246 / JCM 15787 / PB90-1) TaxID=452637 RepID=B1ZX08_OPITP|nr:hypothetical protein [Opitutus terrae]ACB75119.1 hypothetical protein Oter_1836 [Opitutus terrae PB90-1]